MFRKLLFCLVALASSWLGAAEIKGPDGPVKPYKFIDVTVTGKWEAAIWEVQPFANVDQRTASNGMAFCFVAPPGAYKVRCVLVDFSKKKLAQETLEVVISGTDPPKPPDPPNPPNPPGPEPGAKQLMLFYQRDKLDNYPAGQQALLGSLKLQDSLKSKGHLLKGRFDPGVTGPDGVVPADLAPWFQAAKGQQLPCAIVAPMNGGQMVAYPLPADEAGLDKLLGGK